MSREVTLTEFRDIMAPFVESFAPGSPPAVCDDLFVSDGRAVWHSRAWHERMIASDAQARVDGWKECEHGYAAPTWDCVRCTVKVDAIREKLLAAGCWAVRDIP